ncbi:MAG: hypothetical protein M3126_07440 [Candidatus Eremiobacteraeota bacterium]|nr:hypothetical protein [Candidatus Eremiobacteraeota bacterium]
MTVSTIATRTPSRFLIIAHLSIAGVDIEIGTDNRRLHDLIMRRYSRMANHEAPGPDTLKAFIMTRSGMPRVIMGAELIDPFERDQPNPTGKYSIQALEGRAMLAINQRVLSSRPELVVFHGAAISVRGRAAVLAGTSMAGKTTTALSLLAADVQNAPLSDEFTIINTSTGTIESFPRLFSVRAGGRRLLGLTSLKASWPAFDPVGFLSREWSQSADSAVFFFITGKATHPRVRKVTKAEAIFLAFSSTMDSLRLKSLGNLDIVDRIQTGLRDFDCYDLKIGPPAETAELIQSLTSASVKQSA